MTFCWNFLYLLSFLHLSVMVTLYIYYSMCYYTSNTTAVCTVTTADERYEQKAAVLVLALYLTAWRWSRLVKRSSTLELFMTSCNYMTIWITTATLFLAAIFHWLPVSAHRHRKTFIGLRPSNHVTPALKQLHWLPIKHRIRHKLCQLMY